MAEHILFTDTPQKSSFAVIGAGNGGQAMAGFLALKGFGVNLWNRSKYAVETLNHTGGIILHGEISGRASPNLVTQDMGLAINETKIIMVTVPASGHRYVAKQMAPWLSDGQIIVLNPGRTGGALEFKKILSDNGCRCDVTVAETGTFIYASRTVGPGRSHIYSIKHRVPVAALPACRTMQILPELRRAFPQFIPAESVLFTGFDNIGAIFHPLPTILNAGRVESNLSYEHYRDGITPSVARALEKLDQERISVAKAFGVRARTVLEWMKESYGIEAQSIYEAVQMNPGYRGIAAPTSLDTRYIFEDVPFSLVPISSFAKIAGIETPLLDATVSMANSLHGVDYWKLGRTAAYMGISDTDIDGIANLVLEGDGK